MDGPEEGGLIMGVAIPQEDRVATLIYRVYEERSNAPRTYLGGSVIGSPCERALWYAFRNASEVDFNGRMLRLFDTGHREEARIIEELRAAGLEVHDRDPDTGEQFGFDVFGGHVASHIDGVVIGVPEAEKTPHLLEVKTHNVKSFAALKKDGVKKSKPRHYGQMQFYMGGMSLTRALYVAVNKDDDSIYSERVHFDREEYERLMQRAERAVFSVEPPARISEDPAWHECKFCDHYETCWGKVVPKRDCRTCAMSDVKQDGTWECIRWSSPVPKDKLTEACDEHVYSPSIITFADAVGVSPDNERPYIVYQHRETGVEFVSGNPENFTQSEDNDRVAVFTSADLAGVETAMIDQTYCGIREQFWPSERGEEK